MSDRKTKANQSGIAKAYRDNLVSLRENILADAVMIGEIPSPTYGEEQIVKYLCDRFTEENLDQITIDEVNNATAIIPGKSGKKNILVAAHLDSVWDQSVDHTVAVTTDSLIGAKIADNSLGVASLTTLPFILRALEIELDANLILLGTSRSLGRGDLGGLRFFTDHVTMPIGAAVCLESIQLGRLSYSSLGMNRCELKLSTPERRNWEAWSLSGSIVFMNQIVQRILSIETPEVPKTSIIMGSIKAGTSFNVPPQHATLRFELRSEEPGMVARIRDQIQEVVEEVVAENQIEASLEILAKRRPGSIGFTHPYVRAARDIMKELDIEPIVAPSTSELSVLLDKGIPSMTLGITKGDNKHQLNETIKIAPIFSGLAQLVRVLQSIDNQLHDEQN